MPADYQFWLQVLLVPFLAIITAGSGVFLMVLAVRFIRGLSHG